MAMKVIRFYPIWFLGIVVMLGTGARNASAISCLEAIIELMPCQDYLLGSSSGVTVLCCEGAQELNQIASYSSERRNLCECFKTTAAAMGVNADWAKLLPIQGQIQEIE
ncbi:unnamed protein product [Fraxinus pennsylvanica]|uniref:Bifunctional inhibitor/plant lipid transfer protein/seed storage helical domain-containing protein n=1 Tax=Fraxinus pennsylvanica TaxID=56036 RepID=A0AAD2EAZ6_9LAMI|nr:unnamed protein product [Fraxinus pennsylvanica]